MPVIKDHVLDKYSVSLEIVFKIEKKIAHGNELNRSQELFQCTSNIVKLSGENKYMACQYFLG